MTETYLSMPADETLRGLTAGLKVGHLGAMSPERARMYAPADIAERETPRAERAQHCVPAAIECPGCGRRTRVVPLSHTDDVTHAWTCACRRHCEFGGRFGGLIEQLPNFGPGSLRVRLWSVKLRRYGRATPAPSRVEIRERAAIVRQCRGARQPSG